MMFLANRPLKTNLSNTLPNQTSYSNLNQNLNLTFNYYCSILLIHNG